MYAHGHARVVSPAEIGYWPVKRLDGDKSSDTECERE
jgi:hypothetical protein